MSKYKIELDVTEEDMTLLVGLLALAEREKPGASRHATHLKAKLDRGWIEGTARRAAQVVVEEKLQSLRGYLFRLKGYLETTGYPRVALDWVAQAIKDVKTLQQEV